MAATAASQIIFFIAAMVVSVAVVGTLVSTTNNFSNDIKRRGSDMGDSMLTSIDIINDEGAMPYNATNKTLTLYVMNTGSTVLSYSNTSVRVLINGTAYTNLSFVMPTSGSSWAPQTTVTIYVHELTMPKNKDYDCKVIVIYGVNDKIRFTIK